MTVHLFLFVVIVAGAAFAAVWAAQRRDEHQPTTPGPESAWACPECGFPVTSEPPYWTVNAVRYCSLSCARDAWPREARDE